jgi:hypothetical protein
MATMKVGGLGKVTKIEPEVEDMVQKLKPEIEAKVDYEFPMFSPTLYRTQVRKEQYANH